LKSIDSDGAVLTVSEDEYFREHAYVLRFTSDSTFNLNTSVNLAQGNYSFNQKNNISISNYQEYTEVAAVDTFEKKLNELLIKSMNKVNKYMIIENMLIFEGGFGEIKFVKI
jgi:hypothetical protein